MTNSKQSLSVELADLAEKAGYSMIFNAIADAVRLEWDGTAIGISPTKFIAAIRSRSPLEDNSNG